MYFGLMPSGYPTTYGELSNQTTLHSSSQQFWFFVIPCWLKVGFVFPLFSEHAESFASWPAGRAAFIYLIYIFSVLGPPPL